MELQGSKQDSGDSRLTQKWKGVFYAVAYGLAAKVILTFGMEAGPYGAIAALTTISFMFLVPFIMGMIIALHWVRLPIPGKFSAVSIPLIAVLGLFAASILFQKQGMIYALVAFPIYLFMAIAGSVTGRYVFALSKNSQLIYLFLILPFLVAPLEHRFGASNEVYSAQSCINIRSSDSNVWQNIVRVKAIAGPEHLTLFQFAGFPKPIRAEFDTVVVGEARTAFFDRGLLFTETITKVVPNKMLAFTIKADPGSKPPTSLEKQLIIEGKYFEVLEGKYEIEKTGNNEIKLHLSSRYRLSTHFNFYSSIWGRIIMDEIQRNILKIVKHRSEQQQ